MSVKSSCSSEVSAEVCRIAQADWTQRASDHRERLHRQIGGYLKQRVVGLRHPVFDFLFTYYRLRPAELFRWSPGAEVLLENGPPSWWCGDRRWAESGNGAYLRASSFPHHRIDSLRWVLDLLRRTALRSPHFACHGLHEWAMVFDPADIRHTQLPLRLPHREIVNLVRSRGTSCTHFDAFRFFSAAARSGNVRQLTAPDRPLQEQPGCLHANMDLYKWSAKFHPWIPSELLADSFLLAWEIRILDMRASPYDLSSLGWDPVPIETPAGRRDYEAQQRVFAERAGCLRRRLIAALSRLLDRVNSV